MCCDLAVVRRFFVPNLDLSVDHTSALNRSQTVPILMHIIGLVLDLKTVAWRRPR